LFGPGSFLPGSARASRLQASGKRRGRPRSFLRCQIPGFPRQVLHLRCQRDNPGILVKDTGWHLQVIAGSTNAGHSFFYGIFFPPSLLDPAGLFGFRPGPACALFLPNSGHLSWRLPLLFALPRFPPTGRIFFFKEERPLFPSSF